uniref:antibiotic biosynthesis monooxygenase family protein n=2 Tax=Lachnospirales TaxID=3085636 RepID=UPI0022E8DE62
FHDVLCLSEAKGMDINMGNVIVLFEVTIKDGKMEDYLKMAAGLKDALSQAEGFIRSERFSSLAVEGKLLSMSVWKDEASVERWRNLAMHRMCQKHGRMEDFADYTITVVTPLRTYTMTGRTEAPADSNRFLEV